MKYSALILLAALNCFADESGELLLKAETHYISREVEKELLAAIETYEKVLLTQPSSFDGSWKLARAYWYRGNSSAADKKPFFERGIDAGEKAVLAAPDRCEGHFWLGINYALLAESSGVFAALGLVDDVKKEINRAMEIDENCECGGPQRVLGKLYSRLPWFKGGSKDKAVEFLKKSLELCPADTQSKIFLAEIYVEQKKFKEAGTLLNEVVVQEPDPNWIPETKQNKIVAEKMIQKLP